ncbi:response regulator transcription factor [Neptuniibacter halophilus]|uniref:response regulator transcription factor n=1 Tax=Neptuniibacter halophilus TaxID=651666 RepID=UPI002573D761|nr:response regulator [Neptuniibacter halophilus]
MTDQIVYVVDDDEDVRDSLQWLLESVDLQVESYATAQAFLDAYPAGQSGCVLMDVRMPGLSGLSAQKKLPDYEIDIPLIMISAHGNVDMAVTAMTQGARTFIEKPFNDQTLLDHVQRALDQDRAQREQRQQRQQIQRRFATLTKREKQVFERVIEGLSNQEVADALAINRKTVEGHRANMMAKMEAGSLAELIQMAVQLGVLGRC